MINVSQANDNYGGFGASPIRIAAVGNREVRFYLSPLEGPDFPWVDFNDVLRLALLPDDYIEASKEQWARVFPDRVRHLPSGVTIVPDSCARGLFEWCEQCGWVPAVAAGRAFEEAAAEVLASLYCHLPPAVFRDFLQKAALRNNPLELGRAN